MTEMGFITRSSPMCRDVCAAMIARQPISLIAESNGVERERKLFVERVSKPRKLKGDFSFSGYPADDENKFYTAFVDERDGSGSIIISVLG